MSSSSLLAQGIRSTALQIDYGDRVAAGRITHQVRCYGTPSKQLQAYAVILPPGIAPPASYATPPRRYRLRLRRRSCTPKTAATRMIPHGTPHQRGQRPRERQPYPSVICCRICVASPGGVRVLAAVPFERSIEGKRTRLDGPYCQNDRCLHREKG